MSRRRTGAPWAATSVPVIRRQWCNALEASYAIKGPKGAPLIVPKPRVHVLRKGH